MSADLFAAFDDPPPRQSSPGQPKPEGQPVASSADPFDFFHSGSQATKKQQTQPWPALQSTSNDSWGGFGGGQTSSATSGATFASTASSPPRARVQQTQPWPPLQSSSNGTWTGFGGGQMSSANAHDSFDDEDDGWGDFETADPEPSPKPTSQPSTNSLPAASFAKPPPQHPAIQRTRIIRAPTIELMTNSLIDMPGANALPDEVRSPPWMRQSFDQQQKSISQQPPKVKKHKPDADVLFDADEFDGKNIEDGDDDFGDFETTTSPVQAAPTDLVSDDFFTPPPSSRLPMTARRMNTNDMFSALSLDTPMSPYPQAPRSPSFQDRNPFPGLALNTPIEPKTSTPDNNRKTSPVTAWPTMGQNSAGSNKMDDPWSAFENLPDEPKGIKQDNAVDDDWGDWDSFDAKKPSSAARNAETKTAKDDVSDWAWDAVDVPTNSVPQTNEDKSPPINIPPPSVLLSIFPQLLGQASDALFKPVSGQAFSIKNRILSDPKTIDFLRGYLLLATVAARIVAGRKHRWHRDKFLSQSMSISAAGSKGMKLAGVDKTQAAREDRESGDILDIWKEHVGRLRSSVATANTSIKDASQHLKIPELRENMPAQTAKGALSAPKACFICGLKRDERIARVDFDVEDSFGEWWTEHWGHTACKRFWLEHEGALRQR
ncbi:hypothetical protein BKA67DRAFT_658459 [Truncatella angustata]|uniref:Uncharacterized protein n=1 Tax=Truncatella angustata TaxID=152316 RepID=A0A9P8ZWV1_9PEZI|nr:uncharacterized protein BKA67DRAFT_658459 [Truncatella angustata]KAH6654137.1 hypothetical protein BKA67DRAFT_658459 [Truncatella angustata]